MKLTAQELLQATRQLAHKLAAPYFSRSHRTPRHRHTTTQLLGSSPPRKSTRKPRRK